jgi:hypothetical protein
MEIKRGEEKYIEVGRSLYQSVDTARAEADRLEERLFLSCVVTRMSRNSFKIFCRGRDFSEIEDVWGL